MKIAVLGTGMVGGTLGRKLVELGHGVMMGSRAAGNQKALDWVFSAGAGASEGSFADAAGFAEMVVNATAGIASLDALTAAGAGNLEGKILIDVSNPLDFSSGMPPTLSVGNTDSLGEQIQRAFPGARVVKTLNTVSAPVMADPSLVPGGHTLFMCGNDPDAKAQVVGLLTTFGWPPEDIMDLGDISNARGLEMYLPIWVRIFGALGTPMFNVKVVKGS